MFGSEALAQLHDMQVPDNWAKDFITPLDHGFVSET